MNKKETNWRDELKKSKRDLNIIVNEYKYNYAKSETIIKSDNDLSKFGRIKIIFKEPIINNEFIIISKRINEEFKKFVFDNKDSINKYFLNFYELSKRQNAKNENNRIGFNLFITKLISLYFIDINDFNDCFNNLIEVLDEDKIVNIFILLSYIENSILGRIIANDENYSYESYTFNICSDKNNFMGWKNTWQTIFENEERSLSFYLFNDTSYIINDQHEEKYKRKFYNFFTLLSFMCEIFINKSIIDKSKPKSINRFIIYFLIKDLSLFNKYLMMINYKKSKDIMSSFLNIFIKLFIFDILKEKDQIQSLMAHFINNNHIFNLTERACLSNFSLSLGSSYYRGINNNFNRNHIKYYLRKNAGALFSNYFIIDMESFDIENNSDLFDFIPDFNQDNDDIVEKFNIKYHKKLISSIYTLPVLSKQEEIEYNNIKNNYSECCFDSLDYFRSFVDNIEYYDGFDEALGFSYNNGINRYCYLYGIKFSMHSNKQKLFYNNYDFIQLFLDIFKYVFKNSKNENKYNLIKYIYDSKKITNGIEYIDNMTKNDFLRIECNSFPYNINGEDFTSNIIENSEILYNNIFFKNYLSNNLKKSDLKESDNHFALITDFRNTDLDNILIVERNDEYYEVKRNKNIFIQLFKLLFSEEEFTNDSKIVKIILKS